MLGFNPGIQKTQGRASRYVHRKQRASTKVHAAAGVAVKLATACHIQPFFYVMFGLEPDISFLDCRIKSDNDSIIFSSVILELFPVIFGLGPNISFRFPYQVRDDRGEEKSPAMTKEKLSLSSAAYSMSSPDKHRAFRGSLDCRVKSDNDEKK